MLCISLLGESFQIPESFTKCILLVNNVSQFNAIIGCSELLGNILLHSNLCFDVPGLISSDFLLWATLAGAFCEGI